MGEGSPAGRVRVFEIILTPLRYLWGGRDMLHTKIIPLSDQKRNKVLEDVEQEIKKLKDRYAMGCERKWAQYRINAVWEEIQKAERKYNELMQS